MPIPVLLMAPLAALAFVLPVAWWTLPVFAAVMGTMLQLDTLVLYPRALLLVPPNLAAAFALCWATDWLSRQVLPSKKPKASPARSRGPAA